MTHDFRVVPFRRWHYWWLAGASPSAEGGNYAMTEDQLVALEGQNSWTAVVDGEVVIIAGTIEHWKGRHQAWAYFARNTGPHMLAATRAVKKNLLGVRGRVEFTVRKDFEKGQRWARLLGFEVETPLMKGYGPEGESHIGYVRHL